VEGVAGALGAAEEVFVYIEWFDVDDRWIYVDSFDEVT
jgi:hypothetical protein